MVMWTRFRAQKEIEERSCETPAMGYCLRMSNTKRTTTNTTISNAAAALGRKGGAAKTEAQAAAGRVNGTKGGRPAFGIQNTGDIKVIKFSSASVRDAWVAEWPDTRAKITSKDIRFSDGVCRVDAGDCWDIVAYVDRS